MLNLTITVTRYNEPNWLIEQTLTSLVNQKDIQATILFLDQKNDPELECFCKENTNNKIDLHYQSIPAISLSYARNFAIQHCKTDVLLFIDSDAIAQPDWAHFLSSSLLENKIAIAGGAINPIWHNPPILLAKSKIVQEQYSLLNLGNNTFEINKVIGANFGINIKRLGAEGYFDEKLGRRDGVLLGGEETDLCTRATNKGLKIKYVGKAIVGHNILSERISYKWIFIRLYFAGYGRALRGGKPSPFNKKRTIWDYILLPIILVPYTIGFLKSKIMG